MARRSRRHRRSMKPNRRHRLRRNIFGTDIMTGVVAPILGGTAGFIAARAIGNFWAQMPNFPLVAGNARAAKLAAAIAGLPLVYYAGKYVPAIKQNSAMILLGMGVAATEGYLRDTPWLAGSPTSLLADLRARASTTPSAPAPAPATSGFGADYYTAGMLGEGVDISHYGAPYKGMLGLGYSLGADPADQSVVDGALDHAEGISTVIPTDVAAIAPVEPQIRRVREQMVSRGDRGHAGGVFARHLFSAMSGG